MTDKRFTYKHFDWLQWHIYKDGEFFIEVTYCEEDAKKLCELLNELAEENEQLKEEVEMLRNGLKAYDEALPLYLNCEDIMHFKNSDLFEFEMERMDFYKKYPNRVHYK